MRTARGTRRKERRMRRNRNRSEKAEEGGGSRNQTKQKREVEFFEFAIAERIQNRLEQYSKQPDVYRKFPPGRSH